MFCNIIYARQYCYGAFHIEALDMTLMMMMRSISAFLFGPSIILGIWVTAGDVQLTLHKEHTEYTRLALYASASSNWIAAHMSTMLHWEL